MATLLRLISLYCAEALELTSVPPLRWLLLLSGGGVIVSLLIQRPYRRGLWKPFYWFAFAHLLFFVAALLVGWFGELGPSTRYDPSGPATLWLYVIQVGSVISCAFWIIRMSGIRWFAASLMLLLEVLTLGAVLASGMAISGTFL